MTDSGTDDPAHDRTLGGNPIREHDGQRNAVRETECHQTALAIIPARVVELHIGRLEELGRELEIEATVGYVPVALRRIPVEGHYGMLRLYIHGHKGAGPSNENAFCCAAANKTYSCSRHPGRRGSSNAG